MQRTDHHVRDTEGHPVKDEERGAARDTMSIAAIAESMASRTAPSSGSSVFVIQA
jgi:hypothetical protein